MARLPLLVLFLVFQQSVSQTTEPTSSNHPATATNVTVLALTTGGEGLADVSSTSTEASTTRETPQVYTVEPEPSSTSALQPSTSPSTKATTVTASSSTLKETTTLISQNTSMTTSSVTTVTDNAPSVSTTSNPSTNDHTHVASTPDTLNVTSNELHYANTTNNDVKNITDETDIAPEDNAIYLNFRGDCDPNISSSSLEFVQYQVGEDGECSLVLKFTPDGGDWKQVVNQMKPLVGKLLIHHNDKPWRLAQLVRGTNFFDNDTRDSDDAATQGAYIAGLSYSEFVSYLVIGCCFGTVLLATSCLLCIKCCHGRRKSDLTDIPHLSLRLEDYALTRIPRPNTMYSETSKSPIPNDDNASMQELHRSRNGREDSSRVSKAYDTGVVPLDDYESARYATPSPYLHNGGHNELRTFRGRNQDGNQLSPTEIEERDNTGNNGSYATNSTERLARDFYKRKGAPYSGEENPNFKT